ALVRDLAVAHDDDGAGLRRDRQDLRIRAPAWIGAGGRAGEGGDQGNGDRIGSGGSTHGRCYLRSPNSSREVFNALSPRPIGNRIMENHLNPTSPAADHS